MINYFNHEEAGSINTEKPYVSSGQEQKSISQIVNKKTEKKESEKLKTDLIFGSVAAQVQGAGELVIINEKGEKTGILDHEIVEEIDYSLCDEKNFVRLISEEGFYYEDLVFQVKGLLDIYRHIEGREKSTYDLKIALKTDDEKQRQINLMAVPIDYNVIHQYKIDWKNLNAEHGITMEIDEDGDGIFELSKEFGSEIISG